MKKTRRFGVAGCTVIVLMLAAPYLLGAASHPAEAQVGNTEMHRLHDELNLNGSQDDSWRSFQNAYQIIPGEEEQRRQAIANLAQLSAPQRIDTSIAQAQRDLDELQHRGAALKAFYATLSPEQQSTFDRDTAPSGP